MEANVNTPWSSMRSANLLLDNTATGNDGYQTHVTLTGDSRSYDIMIDLTTANEDIRELVVKVINLLCCSNTIKIHSLFI